MTFLHRLLRRTELKSGENTEPSLCLIKQCPRKTCVHKQDAQLHVFLVSVVMETSGQTGSPGHYN